MPRQEYNQANSPEIHPDRQLKGQALRNPDRRTQRLYTIILCRERSNTGKPEKKSKQKYLYDEALTAHALCQE